MPDNEPVDNIFTTLGDVEEQTVRTTGNAATNIRPTVISRGIIPERRNNNMARGDVLDTVGIEIESLGLSRDSVANLLRRLPRDCYNNFEVHRDGSSEINAYAVNLNRRGRNPIYVNAHTPEAENLFRGIVRASTLGYELISRPMYNEDAKMSLMALLPILENNGDFISERCADHIHVGAMKNLTFLKNALSLGLWCDDLFYAISGMGRRFRGHSNYANYARPIQNASYFRYGDYYFQTLNWKKALEAKTIYEFFACFALDINGEIQKYHPARYIGINIYSVARIGTLEFRHFNQTFDAPLLAATVTLCQMFTEIAIRGSTKELRALPVANVFEKQSVGYYLDKLYRLIDMSHRNDGEYTISNQEIKHLERVISNYEGIGVPDIPVMSHCRDLNYDSNIIHLGGLVRAKTKPVSPNQVDIHNIKFSSIMKGK